MSNKKLYIWVFASFFVLGVAVNLFKHYYFMVPSYRTLIDFDKNPISVTETYSLRDDGCYDVGLFSWRGDVDQKRLNMYDLHNGVYDINGTYGISGKYRLRYYADDTLVYDKNFTDNGFIEVSGAGANKPSRLAFQKFEIPFEGKYRKLKIRLDMENPDKRFSNTFLPVQMFVGKSLHQDGCRKDSELLHNQRLYAIDNGENNSALTPLYQALKNKNITPLKHLIENNGTDPQTKMSGDRRALHYAAFFNNDTAVSYLIRKKVVIDATDIFGKTPLQYAIENNATKAAKVLLENGADLSRIKEVDNYSNIRFLRDKNRFIAYTSLSYMFEMTELLLKHGANPNYRGDDIMHNTVYDTLLEDSIVNENDVREGKPPLYPDNQKMVDLIKRYGGKTQKELKDQENTIMKKDH